MRPSLSQIHHCSKCGLIVHLKIAPPAHHVVGKPLLGPAYRLWIRRCTRILGNPALRAERFLCPQEPTLKLPVGQHNGYRKARGSGGPSLQFGAENRWTIVICIKNNQNGRGAGAVSCGLFYGPFQCTRPDSPIA